MIRTPARTALLVPALLALIASAAPADARSRAERRATELAAWVPDGEPVSCIDRARLRETRVLNDSTIDFVMNNGTRFRNTLPNRCPQLGFNEAFGYQTSINQLCNVDIITVVQTTGTPNRGASCGLGLFQPMKRAETPAQTSAAAPAPKP
jgi:hypothetical protein